MEEIDNGKDRLKILDKELKQAEHEVEKQRKELEQRLHDENHTLKQAQDRRQLLLGDIDEETCMKYQKIRKKHGTAVTDIVKGNCGGCFMKVRPQIASLVRGNDSLLNW